MSHWLPPATPTDAPAPTFRADPKTERQLRRLDLALALAALAVTGVPLALARLAGRIEARPQLGAHGREIRRLQMVLPEGRLGRLLGRLGARHWPQLLNVLRGDLAWVGPTWLETSPVREIPEAAGVRPGLVSLWTIRRRTAVDFGTQAEADLEYLAHRGLRHDLGVLLRGVMVGLLPLPRHAPDGRVRICDVAFENVTMPEAVARLRDMLDGSATCQVSFVNPACVNIAARDRGYRRALARAAMVLPDGIGTKIAGDMLGTPIRQNVNGTDLFPRMCDMLDARRASVYLLGGQAGVPQAVADAIRARWPQIRIAGTRDGFFSVAEEGDVAAAVRASGADVLLVARGVPMQDVFIDRYLPLFGVRYAMGVGGLFDFVSGRIDRAPRWMRDSGLEWVYRLMQEPGRMWKRYLVGNFTFLGRVALQRLGLRRGADDLQVLPEPAPVAALAAAGGVKAATPSGVRAVVFAADAVAPDLPAAPDHPSALLPLGHATFIERCMELLAHASIVDVDLVVSHRPEALRRIVGNGQRWGLRVRWHLARDAERPYDMLRVLDLAGVRRVVIGHASQWIRPDAMQQLANREQIAMVRDAQAELHWAGWATVPPARLQQIPSGCDKAGLRELIGRHAGASLFLFADQLAQASSAEALVRAQHTVVDHEDLFDLPASWIRTPWGGMSPSARLHPAAKVEGPALIGPGCFVGEGAIIGPHVVLMRDVVVSAGTLVRDSVVMPETFLGSGLDLTRTVVNGNRVAHLSLGVKTVLPTSDGLLMDMRRQHQALAVPMASRAAAAAGLALLAPLAGADALVRRLRGRPARWVEQAVIAGRDEQSGQWLQAPMRCPAEPQARGAGALVAQFGPLLDVAQGRRAWFGTRPRTVEVWQSLNPDWQNLLADAPVGVFHAPAWSGDPESRTEAEAAADAFHVVQHGASEKLRAVIAAATGAWRHDEAAAAPARPAWQPGPSPAAEPAASGSAAPAAPRRQTEMADA